MRSPPRPRSRPVDAGADGEPIDERFHEAPDELGLERGVLADRPRVRLLEEVVGVGDDERLDILVARLRQQLPC
jgi:hypothetical protein